MKGIVAVDVAYQSVGLALDNIAIENVHGINGRTPEETMRNMGFDCLTWHGKDRRNHCKGYEKQETPLTIGMRNANNEGLW
jgi:hypothetical protein